MNSKTNTKTDEGNDNPIDVLEEAIVNFRKQRMVPEDTSVWLHLTDDGPALLSDWPKNGDAVCAMPIVESDIDSDSEEQ